MDFKKLRINATSYALSVFVTASGSLVLAQPVFAADEDLNEEVTVEEVIDEEVKEDVKQEEVKQEETKSEETTPVEEVKSEEIKPEEATTEKVEVSNEEDTNETTVETNNSDEVKTEEVTEEKSEEKTEEFIPEQAATVLEKKDATTESSNEQHKVSVVTTKVDENGNPLVGATLQIIDKDGNVVDEWVSDGSEHISMLPEGDYILREKGAPEGYITAADKNFTVVVIKKDINADVEHDDSHDVCWHYGGVALYYIESEGVRDEVYCINQDWDEPHGISYDGLVLNSDNIRTFTPDSDTSMSNDELYDKVLDIIYHRSQAEELFPELSETEIRFITEYALKTYTSAEVTTQQAKRDENGRIMRDENGNIIYEDIRFLRYYRYDPTTTEGYVIDPDNGDGLGKLAQHWWTAHNHTKIPAEYAALFYYLINSEEKHPDDMFLYIYSTKNPTADGESYQNLLGVRWFDPYDEEYKTYLTMINEKENIPPEEPEKPPIEPEKPEKPEKPVIVQTKTTAPQTGDETNLYIPALACLGAASALTLMITRRKKENEKIK